MGVIVNSRILLILVLICCTLPNGLADLPKKGEATSKEEEARSETYAPWVNADSKHEEVELRQAKTFFHLKRLQSDDPKMRQHYVIMEKQMLFYLRRKQLESQLKEIDHLRSANKLDVNKASILDEQRRKAHARFKSLKLDKASWEKQQVKKLKQESPELMRRPPTPEDLQRGSEKRKQNQSLS